MAPHKIMIIRHAERPIDGGKDQGVQLDGTPNENFLTVRGWQRAGALVRLFYPLGKSSAQSPIERPTSLYAAHPDDKHHSHRTHSTLQPLADLLGFAVNTDHARGEEAALAEAIRHQDGIALIAWEHKAIHEIVTAMTQSEIEAPIWPDDRFDMIFILTADPAWRLVQVPQQLLAGDQASIF
ncbi:histidine phosphatase family protein [Rhizobium sp. NPDC090279]|uniref:histidine phosphatase family protein n=1 Tax=Rhizobium sp. NPDC090279 TaxID=3364499 RepID=UPI003839EFFF